MANKNARNFTVKVWKDNKLVARCQTKSIRRAVDRLQRADFRENGFRVYIRVSYGDRFYNDGEYTSRKELDMAWKAFIE